MHGKSKTAAREGIAKCAASRVVWNLPATGGSSNRVGVRQAWSGFTESLWGTAGRNSLRLSCIVCPCLILWPVFSLASLFHLPRSSSALRSHPFAQTIFSLPFVSPPKRHHTVRLRCGECDAPRCIARRNEPPVMAARVASAFVFYNKYAKVCYLFFPPIHPVHKECPQQGCAHDEPARNYRHYNLRHRHGRGKFEDYEVAPYTRTCCEIRALSITHSLVLDHNTHLPSCTTKPPTHQLSTFTQHHPAQAHSLPTHPPIHPVPRSGPLHSAGAYLGQLAGA